MNPLEYCFSCANKFEIGDDAYLITPALSHPGDPKMYICKGCLEIFTSEPYTITKEDLE